MMVSVGGLACVLTIAYFAPDDFRKRFENQLTTLWVSFLVLALVSGTGMAV